MPHGIRLRHATPRDARMIRRVHLRSVNGLAGTHYSPEQLEAWMHGRKPADYRAALERGEIMIVAEDHGRIVGFSSIELDEVRAVFVAPDHAGMGVGSMLLGALEKEALARGIDELVVYASLNGEAFYRRRGFRRIRQLNLRLGNDAILPAVMMVKNLDGARKAVRREIGRASPARPSRSSK